MTKTKRKTCKTLKISKDQSTALRATLLRMEQNYRAFGLMVSEFQSEGDRLNTMDRITDDMSNCICIQEILEGLIDKRSLKPKKKKLKKPTKAIKPKRKQTKRKTKGIK